MMQALQTPSKEDVQNSYAMKRAFFDSGATKSYEFRVEQLQTLRHTIEAHQNEILEALHADMRKPVFEAYLSEIQIVYDEIDHAVASLQQWMTPLEVPTPEALQPASSFVRYDPLGIVLVIGPWNYPFQLLITPLIGAIAAGNCAMVKPSHETSHTAAIINKVISEAFDENYISAVHGPGSSLGPLVIENNRFDHIFFTGSPRVGKLIAGMAAEHLTPVTLELGGKSPVIIDKQVDLEMAARRVTWAKFFNAGQTCVCPDYVLVHEDIKDDFVAAVKQNITAFFGNDPKQSTDFARIVNEKRVNALTPMLSGNIVAGGDVSLEDHYIAPTVIDDVDMNHPAMHDEIFGPIMPILTWRDRNDVVAIVRQNRYPLAMYIFSDDQDTVEFFQNNIESGGAVVNSALIHLANPDLPFGGVGNSGYGRYHGRDSFHAMSHHRSVLVASTETGLSDTHAPYPSLA